MQLALFAPQKTSTVAPLSDQSFEDRVETAIASLQTILRTEVVFDTCSFGKDSTAKLALVLEAARRLQRDEPDTRLLPIIVLHGDTGVESPAVTDVARDMIDSLHEWSRSSGIDVRVHVYEPADAHSFAVNTLSGGQLPTYANSSFRQCSQKWKVAPAATAMSKVLRDLRVEFATDPEFASRLKRKRPVTLIGTRHEESDVRSANMTKRGENAVHIVEVDGRRLFAPLAHWSEDEVWEMLGTAGTRMGVYPVWQSDFSETIQLYRDAASEECPVVVGTGKIGRAGCGARFGCHTCTAVKTDRSLTAMVEDPRHHHLRGLLRIRNFIGAIQYDWSRRSWLTRQFEDLDDQRHVKVQPDHWNAETLLTVVGAYLTADRREWERAAAFAGALDAGRDPDDPYIAACRAEGRSPDETYLRRMRTPRFRVLSDRRIVGLDWYSAVLGKYRKPFQVLELAHQVWNEGASFDVPEQETAPIRATPKALWIAIPDDAYRMPGLGEPLSVSCLMDSCYEENDLHGHGLDRFVANPAAAFTVNDETAAEVMNWFYEAELREHYLRKGADPFHGVHHLLRLGAISLSPQGRQRLHAVVKQRQVLQAAGLYDLSTEALIGQARMQPALDERQRQRRGGTEVAQSDLQF